MLRTRYRPEMEEYNRATLREWLIEGFTIFRDEIEALGHSVATFADMFYYDYRTARPLYPDHDEFVATFTRVYVKNQKKYAMWLQAYDAEFDPIENYKRHEERTDTRTPDLDTTTNTTTQRNQTRTVTDTPTGWTETETHKVSPYDAQPDALSTQDQIDRTFTGTRSSEEAYSGEPDTLDSTTTTTGTDKTEIVSDIYGNIGTTTSQQMLESHLDLAARMKLAEEIEHDVAKELLLQLWH